MPFASTSSTQSVRDRLFSDEVAKKLEQLTKQLNRTWRRHEKEERLRKNGPSTPSRASGPLSHLIPVSLQPANVQLQPLFRGDKSPDGVRRQRRRARASITLRK